MQMDRRRFLMMSYGLGLGLNLWATRQASGGVLGVPETFSEAVANYVLLVDYDFGTAPPAAGATQIADIAALGIYFQDFRNGEPKPITRNNEVQRYRDFSSAENLVFTEDALELTATLPNGPAAGFTSTTISGAVSNTNKVAVANASNIRVGQVLSLGPAMASQLCQTSSFGIRGTLTIGATLTMTVNQTYTGGERIIHEKVVGPSDTFQTLAQYFVDLLNRLPGLLKSGVWAYKDPINPGGLHVVIPPYNNPEVLAPGRLADGSFQYIGVGSPTATSPMVFEQKVNHNILYVVSKSGNALTLNNRLTVTNGQTLYVNPARVLPRSTNYTSGLSTVIPVGVDVEDVTVGTVVKFGFVERNLRRVVSVDNVAKTITINTGVAFHDGELMFLYPAFHGVQSTATTASPILSMMAVPAGVRVGQQAQVNGRNSNSNLKVIAVNREASPQTVTLNGNVTSASNTLWIFYEPVNSVEIWTKVGWAPGADGNTWIAFELEADFPDIADSPAWAAFWMFIDPTNPTGLPTPSGSGNEIDFTEQYVYSSNSPGASQYQPGVFGTSAEIYRKADGLSGTAGYGNNLGKKTRKIQCIVNQESQYFYVDGVLHWAKSAKYNNSARAQVAANLAVGSTATAFNPNGFFPLDFSQFPMKFRLKRMRVLGAP